jgi:hypothetical protein
MPAEGWDDDFWRGVGLGDLVDESYERIGESSLSYHHRGAQSWSPSEGKEKACVDDVT